MPEELDELVRYNVDDEVAWIVIDRQAKRNSFNYAMSERIAALIKQSEADDAVRAIVLTGAGENFTSGADLSEAYDIYHSREGQTERRPSQRIRLQVDRWEVADRIAAVHFCTKPVLVRVLGYGLGMGAFWIAAADIAIVAEDSRIGMPEEKIGFSGANPVLISMILSMGIKRARDFLLFGKTVSGKEAAELGLVTKAVPAERVDAEVEDALNRIRRIPKDGLAMGKQALNMAYEALGVTHQFSNWTVLHTLFTNLRLEPGEYNMLGIRQKRGTRAAIHERDRAGA